MEVPQEVKEALVSLAAAAITALATVATFYVQRLGAKKVEEKSREVLKEAMATGANAALAQEPAVGSRNDPGYVHVPQRAPESMVETVLGHVAQSVPGAIAVLNPPAAVLTNLALSALQQAMKSSRR
jgi:hypothetical protein